ncbi:MAG: small multi-drug export protein [Siphonobacter sp.]
MDTYGKYLSVVLASMVKFIAGPLAGIALNLSWWETAFFSILGMMTSVFIFTFLGRRIRWWWEHVRHKKRKRFSPSSRRAVRIYRRFGIAGVAFLTPLLFTPVGGTLLAVSFGASATRILSWMLVFGTIWGVLLTLLLYNIPGAQAFFGH